ncbi:MAG: alcohol dehydrogenase catalytic domain-containing protein [Clostridia bacterium]|nr:alcohol dehydrogenase catalytic domain-containing protein [Clostridia bacterium]
MQNDRDAIVRVALASICSGDLHIKHGSVSGITGGHEMVGGAAKVDAAVTTCKSSPTGHHKHTRC